MIKESLVSLQVGCCYFYFLTTWFTLAQADTFNKLSVEMSGWVGRVF